MILPQRTRFHLINYCGGKQFPYLRLTINSHMQNIQKTMKTTLFTLMLISLVSKSQQWDGLTYYSNMGATAGYLIDTNSVVVKTFAFTGGTGYSTHFIPGGTMFRTVQNTGNAL